MSVCPGCGDTPSEGPRLPAVSTPQIQRSVQEPSSPPLTAEEEAAYDLQRKRMVTHLSSSAFDFPITSTRVLDAMRVVPRHEFVTRELRPRSYENNPLPIAEDQTISQPYIVALMTQLLDLKPEEKVLEIGTGSGYQAAILGELAAEVHSVEIRPQLFESSRRILEGLKARGILHHKRLETHLGDGNKGYPGAAPYDAIIVTAAPRSIPVELLNQLKPGGRLVIPVGDFVQELQLIKKSLDGKYTEESIVPVRFVKMDSK